MSHVSLVTLGVADIDRATVFYEALGWHRSSASVDGTVAFLRGGTVGLSLFGRDDLAAEAGVEVASLAGPGSTVLAINLATEAEVDRFVAAVVAAGGTVTAPPTRADWGGYSGYVADPDGHLWEVAHNPAFPLGPDGAVTFPDDT